MDYQTNAIASDAVRYTTHVNNSLPSGVKTGIDVAMQRDSVDITKRAENLQTLEQSILQLPAIDVEHTSATRSKIANGGYQPNDLKTAEKLLDLASAMLMV